MPKSTPDGHEYLNPDEWQSMNALLLLNRRVLADLDSALRRQHNLAVTEFDVLITLHNAPQRRLRMSSLAEQVMLSPAGATHLVTRLERDRLVQREVDPSDRRKWFAVLTDHGDEMLKAARRTHNEVLRRGLLDITTPNERRTLQRLWTRLNQSATRNQRTRPRPDRPTSTLRRLAQPPTDAAPAVPRRRRSH